MPLFGKSKVKISKGDYLGIGIFGGINIFIVLSVLAIMLGGCASKKTSTEQAVSLWWHGLLHKNR